MGVLAHHVPSIEQLKPGLVEIIEESGGTKQFFGMCSGPRTCQRLSCPARGSQLLDQLLTSVFQFSVVVSGGFAVVQPNSQLSINAVEGFPLEDFSPEVNTSIWQFATVKELIEVMHACRP